MAQPHAGRTWGLARACAGLAMFLAGSLPLAAAPLCDPVGTSETERDARLEGRGCLALLAAGPTGREELIPGGLDPGGWVWSRIVEADIVLLGEVHDNPGHHRRRADLIRQIIAARDALPSRRVAGSLVMEQLRAEQRAGLDAFYSGSTRTSAELFRLVQWEKSGWPPQTLFAPIVETALKLGLPIRAGEPPRDLVRTVARKGLDALPANERARLGLDADLEPPLTAALTAELAGSHCGLLPASAFAGMAAAQRFRDAHLAEILIGEVKAQGAAVLIAGNGHVRSDRGVPWHIARRQPRLRTVIVMLIEVAEGAEDATDLVPRDPSGRMAADLVLFTARASRPDPCAAMRERMKGVPPR